MHISDLILEVARYYGEMKKQGTQPVKARRHVSKVFGVKKCFVLYCEQAAKPAGRYVGGVRANS